MTHATLARLAPLVDQLNESDGESTLPPAEFDETAEGLELRAAELKETEKNFAASPVFAKVLPDNA